MYSIVSSAPLVSFYPLGHIESTCTIFILRPCWFVHPRVCSETFASDPMATFGTFGTLPPVPYFLQGAWSRRYIQRATEDGSWGPRSTAPVRYIQTPYAFVDVRAWKDEGVPWKDPARVMAFAGITTTTDTLPPGAGSWTAGGGAPRVSWHACHNWGPAADVEACWRSALSGAPVPTGDVGDFLPVDGWAGAVWRERDPDGTLED